MNSAQLNQIRQQFPILETKVSGRDLVYLDSAATSLRPERVIERIAKFYRYENSNVHRGAHFLSDHATSLYENARSRVQKFINASSADEIVFVRGTTEAINLVASSYGEMQIKAGDEILVSDMEHHANIVPWQLLEKKTGCKVVNFGVLDNGELDYESFKSKLSNKTRLVAVSFASNTLGTINNVELMIREAHLKGALVLLDAAQMMAFRKVDVQKLDCDFLAFSGHKMFAPFGVGVLFAKRAILETMPPYQGGGSMISEVCFSGTSFNGIPTRFEAGTPNIEGAIGLAEAIDFIEDLGLKNIENHESELLRQATEKLKSIPGLTIFGEAADKVGILSFAVQGVHHSDLGHLLNEQGVAVRTGHLCTQPLMKRFEITGITRASLSVYNSAGDIERLYAGILKAKEMFT